MSQVVSSAAEQQPAALQWRDLLDPSAAELDQISTTQLHASVARQLLRPPAHDDEPRPRLESHGEYMLGVFLVPVVPAQGPMHYQEVDLVMTQDRLITVRKTPATGAAAYDPTAARESCRRGEALGMIVYHLVDDIAERHLDMVDRLDDAIEELEDGIETWPAERVRMRIAELRHATIDIRRTLAPFRDVVRRVMEDRLEFEGEEVFTRDVEVSLGGAYDKLLRASEGLESSRELIASVRDFYQAKVANDQNDVMKRMTAIASLLLLPTFIVGLYGQNFRVMPELRWTDGYVFSWVLILVSTVAQLVYFKRQRWL